MSSYLWVSFLSLVFKSAFTNNAEMNRLVMDPSIIFHHKNMKIGSVFAGSKLRYICIFFLFVAKFSP